MDNSNKSQRRHRRKKGLIPEGYIQFLICISNIVCIVPIVLMGVMYGISIGFQEGTRKMVTMYESILSDQKKGASSCD